MPMLRTRPSCAPPELAYQQLGAAAAGSCVATLLSADLLSPGRWGRTTVEINANWAVAHGYIFGLFTSAPVHRRAAGTDDYCTVFAKLHAATAMLEKHNSSCRWLLFLDADAVVNNVSATVEQLADTAATAEAAGSADITLACHWPSADGNGECHSCKCGRSTHVCSAASLSKEQSTDS
eukprot:4747871-Prymnesium_polylepis.1